MIPEAPRAGRAIRYAAAALACAALAACGVSRVDEVSVKWPPFKDGTLVALPSDLAQCPDLAGVYRAQGERREGDPQAALLKDLHDFLLYPLDLPGLRATSEPAWRSSPAATVAFSRAADGWDVLALDGQGARAAGRLPLLAAADGAPEDESLRRPGDALRREAGCTQGRLWVSVRHDWRQHESTGVRRHVAILRKESGGLLVTVQRESDTIGMLLPWYTNDSSQAQYWFAPAADHP
ncbi:hypothetical protein [Achromobacter arsenitoxydans]|uniref:Lipoprotein 13 n=1 Tax=Achromobacter arsenitoxydans SY8 TaxID=477184 RepID=H0FAW6_9BURK|nr:hypothetical protein [Achromobacter arsenitoxydans]EHK64529.1 lipoprotein 13 [Achromobacter arsenitoxydans SY8]